MIRSVIKFARVRIIATCFALAFLGSAAAGGVTPKTFLTLLIIVAFTIHANSVNDYADRDIDRINLQNAPDRPLVTGDVSYGGLWLINGLSGSLALSLSLFYGVGATILTITVLIIDYLYSLKPVRLTDRPIASPVLLSVAYVYLSFSLGYWSAGNPGEYPWVLTAGLCFGFIARLLLKDFRDVKGDKLHGKVTFLLRYGARATCGTSAVFWFLGLCLVVYAASFAPGIVFTLILGFIQVCVLLRDLSEAKKLSEQQNIVALIAKAANFTVITILAYLLCENETSLSFAAAQFVTIVTGTTLLVSNRLHYQRISSVRAVHRRSA